MLTWHAATEERLGRPVTLEDIARIHNSGIMAILKNQQSYIGKSTMGNETAIYASAGTGKTTTLMELLTILRRNRS